MKALFMERVRDIRKYFLTGVLTILVTSYLVPPGSAQYTHLTSVSGERTMFPGSLGFGIGPAPPYNRDNCESIFGSPNVKVTTVKLNTSKVDFGDEPHLGASPQGDAVICWATDGRVAVKGKLYSDNFWDPQTVRVEVRFRRANGSVTNSSWKSFSTNGGVVSHRNFIKVSPAGNFTEVRIRLKLFLHTDLGEVNSIEKTETFTRSSGI